MITYKVQVISVTKENIEKQYTIDYFKLLPKFQDHSRHHKVNNMGDGFVFTRFGSPLELTDDCITET